MNTEDKILAGKTYADALLIFEDALHDIYENGDEYSSNVADKAISKVIDLWEQAFPGINDFIKQCELEDASE